MATYKVSYKMLAKQGEELKNVAKLIDGYSERVVQVRGKLGDNETLAAVRGNLTKFSQQLTESRAILSTAGGLLTSTVEKYTAVETRQVKNIDNYKAHNRDFYKNPVVVASAGGAGAGAAAASMSQASSASSVSTAGVTSTPIQTASTPVQTASAPAQTTVNYTENVTVNNITQVNVINEPAPVAAETVSMSSMAAEPALAASSPVNMASADVQTAIPSPAASAQAYTPAPAAMPAPEAAVTMAETAAAAAGGTSSGAVAGTAAVAGLAGAALGAGAVFAAKHLGDKKKAEEAEAESATDEYDPEKELEAALERVRLLSEEE